MNYNDKKELYNKVETRQEKLASGINIKTINGQSILGEGDMVISSGSSGAMTKNFIHVSVDDVDTIITYINNSSNASIYGNSMLAAMKDLHEQYGMVFSLYVYQNLSFDTTTTNGAAKKAELYAAREWLKFGYHRIGSKFCDELSESEATIIWNTFANATITCTGSPESIDRMPRLDYFRSGENGLKGFNKAHCGMLGYLCQDDVRTDNIYMNSTTSHWLVGIENRASATASNWYPKDYITDHTLGLRIFKTDFRLDWICKTDGTWQNHDPATGEKSGNAENVYNTLVNWYKDGRHSDTFCPLIIFFHEIEWTSGRLTKTYLEKIAQFASEYNMDFDFPQNRFYTIPTIMDIFPNTSPEPPTPTPTTFTLDGVEVTVVDNISDIPTDAFVKGALQGQQNTSQIPVTTINTGKYWRPQQDAACLGRGSYWTTPTTTSGTAYAIDLAGKTQIRVTDTSKVPYFAMCIVDQEGNIAGDQTTSNYNKTLHGLYWQNTATDGATFTFDETCEGKYLFLWIKNAATPTTDYTAEELQAAFACITVE